jgi:hypothetical protein
MVRPDGSRAGISDGPGVKAYWSRRSGRTPGPAISEPNDAMMEQDKNIAQMWVQELRDEGHEHHVSEPKDCRQLDFPGYGKGYLKQRSFPPRGN